MRLLIVPLSLACLACQSVPAAPIAQPPATPRALPAIDLGQFEIQTNDYVSLHFFAFHAARALSGRDFGRSTVSLFPEDAALLENPAIAEAFAPLAAIYEPALESRLFRGGLFNVMRQLGEGIDTVEQPEIRDAFEAFMPTYRRHFLPRHRAQEQLFKAKLEAELATHGAALLAATADELDATWGEATYRTYVTAYANWAGAFSNDNILVLSATDPDIAAHLLEVFVHETAHGSPIGDTIDPAAEKALAAAGIEHRRFWHYLQFQATGRAAKRVLGDDYVPYVVATGLATRDDVKPWYDALDIAWDSHDTLEARAMAAAAIIAAQQEAP